MKIKSTFLILFISIWVNQFYGQFTPQKPDLRNCGSAPNYYLDYFNCTSNNYTLNDVFLSISNSSGVPITTPCAPPNIQNVFLWLNYTSNSNSSIHQTRIFGDILVKDQNGNLIQTLQINSYLGEVVPGSGQRLLNIPSYGSGFPWTCGYELSLTRLLVVWKTNGNSSDPELSSYNCNTFNKSQCELPTSLIVSAPMAVQFDYTQCTIGNITTVNFDDDTNGGNAPYTYLWNFGDSTTSTLQNPSHTYPYPGGTYIVTLQVTDSSNPAQVSTSVQVITLQSPISITETVTSSPCSSGNVGAIDINVSGGSPNYTYLWSNGATTQDLSGLANGSYTVTVTDSVGCTAQKTFIITGGDVTPPVVTAPANLTLERCDTTIIGSSGYFPFSLTNTTITQAEFLAAGGIIFDASTISNVTYIDTISGTCPKVVTRVFTITDACNNTTQAIQTFTIEDTIDPEITTVASDLTVECDGNGNTDQLNAWLAANGGAVASDACSDPIVWTNNYSELSNLCGKTGSATVTFTATDDCGNYSTSVGTFTIEDTIDPEFTSDLPQNISVSCDAIPVPQELTGFDSCSNQITITTNDDIVENEGNCIGQFTILRTWTITDSCGNNQTHTQTISVFDNAPPTLVTPFSTEVDAICSEIPPKPQLEFTDNCSGVDPNIIYTETTTTISIYQYVIVRNWVVSDNCGNDANFYQTINVSVNEPFDAIPYRICLNETIDLFTLLDSNLPTNGTWVEVNTTGALSGSIFNPSNLAFGYYTIRYIVNVENNPCPFIYEIYINVADCDVLAECDIVVYNAVSPNGDGLNEIFMIDGITCYPDNTVEIYNRWGVNVYKANGYNNSNVYFDGLSQNKLTVGNDKLPGDTYFYILKYNDAQNNSFEKTGYLYIKY